MDDDVFRPVVPARDDQFVEPVLEVRTVLEQVE